MEDAASGHEGNGRAGLKRGCQSSYDDSEGSPTNRSRPSRPRRGRDLKSLAHEHRRPKGRSPSLA
jgi:hypothetical protein